MRTGWITLAAVLAMAAACTLAAQDVSPAAHQCECGAHPPPPPTDRVVAPYAGEPEDMLPYSKFAAPYDYNYTHPNIYSGAGRDVPEPKDITEVRIGFFGPLENNPDSVLGLRMLHGAQLAVEEANARGGYGGKPFKLMLHNDYDNWQAMAVAGYNRPTDPSIWGSASDETVKMVYDDKDWAIFGSISSESTHIAIRVALRAEIPIVNSASTDPTIPETYIPWYFENLQDDRVQGYTLARRIFTERGLKRVALLRINNRYGRFGVLKFRDVARRMGHPVVIEQKFVAADTDFSHQLRVIAESRVDGIVIWADQPQTAAILKQMRAAGMKQPVFGSYRTIGADMLAAAGDAAEGFEAVFPYDPSRNDPQWVEFNKRFEARFHEPTEAFSALAFDAMNALLDSICKAGLNRARIHDALADIDNYQGVTGAMLFDPNQKNVASMFLATVHNGKVSYRVAKMEKEPAAKADVAAPQKPYAAISEQPVEYNGPHASVLSSTIVVFGPKAAEIAKEYKGSALHLIAVESGQSWGKASSELVNALSDSHPLAIVALDRDSAHLSTQMALKFFVPVLALSSDKSLTAVNIPWIFRQPEEATTASTLRLIETAYSQGAQTPEALRNLLASGHAVDAVAFLTTGEPTK
jgi:ABC-type branched-subunit amino acid transport system substrate-binding protein